ncbi:MAG: hypothetical protein C4343_06400, partial [Chloroflexota bacterium]
SASAGPRDAEETPPDIATVTRQDLDIRVEASGIVEARVAEVTAAVGAAGLAVVGRLEEGDWVALLARRGAAASTAGSAG